MSQWGCYCWDLRCTPPPCGSFWILHYYGPVASWCHCNFSVGSGATLDHCGAAALREDSELGTWSRNGRIFTLFSGPGEGFTGLSIMPRSKSFFVQIHFYIPGSLWVIKSWAGVFVLSKGTFQRLQFPQISWIKRKGRWDEAFHHALVNPWNPENDWLLPLPLHSSESLKRVR